MSNIADNINLKNQTQINQGIATATSQSQNPTWYNHSTQLKQALIALKEMRSKLEAEKYAKTEPIAIVGIGCRFPGDANSPEKFWQLLRDGADLATEIPSNRWDVNAYYDPNPEVAGKIYTRRGYFLSDIEKFDAHFFGITPREALTLDPQQRLLLEVCWEALENACQPPDLLRNSQTGIFMGVMHNDYSRRLTELGNTEYLNPYYGTGNGSSFLAGRLSYFLGLHGPSVVIDTACSSSLLSVHLACQSLRLKECRLALAGGVNLILHPDASIVLSRMRALSPDGRCKTFDAQADGYARGEGCGVVVLKRLSDAQKDGDPIFAVIRGSAVNHDGPSSGLTVPSGTAQQTLLQQALENAGVKANQISYVEAHGTGTSLGDPIEVQALAAVYSKERSPNQPLHLASVKTNVGHLESAAGIVGLIKVALALQHKQIPPHLHLETLNPHINLESNQIHIPQQLIPWHGIDGRHLAGVSSFGLSGLNAHLILEASPTNQDTPPQNQRPLHLFTLSAKTQPALAQFIQNNLQYLQAHLDIPIANICASTNRGRSHFPQRLALIVASTQDLSEKLQRFVTENSQGIDINSPQQTLKIAFLFTGQGSQYVRMGQQLYQTQPLFRQILDKCDQLLHPYLECSLLDVLFPPTGDVSRIDETVYTQPTLFAIEYALAQLWMSWGIQPSVVMGHSVGEYVAACIAGVFSLEDGLKLISHRAKLMQALPRNGQMAAVFASIEQVKSIIAPYQQVAIAAVNGPTNIVISGETTAINQVLQTLETKAIKYQLLRVSHAFHSPLMEPMLEEFRQVASEVTYHPPQISIISNLTGQFASFTDIGQPEYWCQHIREAVLFAQGIETLYHNGYQVFLEVGPRPILTGMGQRCLSANHITWLSSLNVGGSDWQYLLNTISQLYLQGAEINWHNFESGYGQHRISLSNYPFQRETFWPQATGQELLKGSVNKNISKIPNSILGEKFCSPRTSDIHFQIQLSLANFPCLADHLVYDTIVVPGAFYLSMFLAAACEVFANNQVTIADVSFLQALIIVPEEEQTIQIVLTPLESGAMSCQLFSLTSTGEQQTSPSWVLHAQAKLSSTNALQSSISLHEIKAKCLNYSPNSNSIYQAANQRGLILGSSFQWLGALWQTEALAFSQMQTPTEISDINNYPLHPGLIDSCFQLLSATLVNRQQELGNYIPIGIEKIQVQKLPITTQLHSYAQLRNSQSLPVGMLVGDIQLIDEIGQVWVLIQGLQIKSVSQAAMLPPQKQDWHKWLYEIQWRQQATSPVNQFTKLSQWLIFADAQGFAASFANHLRQQGQICRLVYPGEQYQVSAIGDYSINPSKLEDWLTLLTNLENIAPVDHILYFWGLEKSSFTQEQTPENLADFQAFTCGGVLHLVQAIAKAKLISSPQLWMITKEAQAVGQIQSLAVEQATLWGLGRVVALEHPEIWGGLIDLDSKTTFEELAVLLADLTQDNSEDLIAWRQGQKYVARLQPKPILPTSSLSINQDATYLITGGLGALGLKVATWMAECGARYLVLTSRSKIDAQTQEYLHLIEKMGTRVMVINADITEPNAVKNLLEDIQRTMPPLRGIIHAAGVLADSILIKQDWPQFARVMAPKVQGAWNLHNQTLDLPLDFFVLFSSAASLIGSVGQSNYAAGNAFLDALAHYRQIQGKPGLSINWGAWGEAGMASTVSQQVQERWQSIGVGEIAPTQGLNALGYLLQCENAQVGVVAIAWSQFLQQFPDGHTPALLTELVETANLTKVQPSVTPSSNLLSQLKAATQNQRLTILTEYIRHEAAQVMGLSSATMLKQQQGLFEMGMDSLMVVELKNRLQKSIEHPLPATLVFEYSTVETLTNYIAQQVFSWQQSTTSDTELLTKDEDTQKLLSELEQLSEDNAEILLAEKLAELEAKISFYE